MEHILVFSRLFPEGKNTRAEIENLLKKEIGGYLTKMERDFNLIKKQQPIFTKSSTKNVKYQIEDNFIMFWFREKQLEEHLFYICYLIILS